MHKILVVAQREYLAAVRTKAFVVSVIVMPLMMLLGFAVQKRTDAMRDTQTYRVVVIDRTPDGKIADAIVLAS
jgi:ABC-type Na+ efflux pump permease subunit